MEQLIHDQIKQRHKQFPITIIAEELRTPQNVGMCLRVSEAFGVQKFYLNNHSPSTDNKLVQRTARNADKILNIEEYDNGVAIIEQLKTSGYTIVALEVTDESVKLEAHDFSDLRKIALVIGSERFGIATEVLDICDLSVAISMFGLNSSMNVVNSLSVCLYEITKQLNLK